MCVQISRNQASNDYKIRLLFPKNITELNLKYVNFDYLGLLNINDLVIQVLDSRVIKNQMLLIA